MGTQVSYKKRVYAYLAQAFGPDPFLVRAILKGGGHMPPRAKIIHIFTKCLNISGEEAGYCWKQISQLNSIVSWIAKCTSSINIFHVELEKKNLKFFMVMILSFFGNKSGLPSQFRDVKRYQPKGYRDHTCRLSVPCPHPWLGRNYIICHKFRW